MNDDKRCMEALRLLGEKDLMEEFDRADEAHVFSNKYKKQKEAMLIKVKNEKAKPRKKKWSKTMKAFMASAAALLLIPATVFAVYKLYTIRVTDRNYAKEVSVEETMREINPVDMRVTYLPEGMEKFEEGKYRDENDERWLTLMLIKADVDAEFMVDNIEDKQEMKLSNRTPVVFGRSAGGGEESYHGAVFYEQQGYIVEMWAEGILETELMNVLEGISLEETTGAGTYAVNLSAQIGERNAEKGDPVDAKGEDSLTNVQVRGIKEKFIYETTHNVYAEDLKTGKLEMSVEEVTVLDNISSIDEDSKSFGKDDEGLADETGKLMPQERKIGEWGDGVDAPTWNTTETRMIQRKLLSVSVRMKNVTGEAVKDMSIFPRLSLLTEKNGDYQWLEEAYLNFNNLKEAYSMDIYGKGNAGKGFYFVDFEKDEEKRITITFLVDEDELDNAFLSYQSGGSDEPENYYVDVRQ
jgi:hypothetical protein